MKFSALLLPMAALAVTNVYAQDSTDLVAGSDKESRIIGGILEIKACTKCIVDVYKNVLLGSIHLPHYAHFGGAEILCDKADAIMDGMNACTHNGRKCGLLIPDWLKRLLAKKRGHRLLAETAEDAMVDEALELEVTTNEDVVVIAELIFGPALEIARCTKCIAGVLKNILVHAMDHSQHSHTPAGVVSMVCDATSNLVRGVNGCTKQGSDCRALIPNWFMEILLHFKKPTPRPTPRPTPKPTKSPTPKPTKSPTPRPTRNPTPKPTTAWPTYEPTLKPTSKPTENPTRRPTDQLTIPPVGRPTREPVGRPTREPVGRPTREPVGRPTREPVARPTREPVGRPTREPVGKPTSKPGYYEPTPRPTPQTEYFSKADTDSTSDSTGMIVGGALAGIAMLSGAGLLMKRQQEKNAGTPTNWPGNQGGAIVTSKASSFYPRESGSELGTSGRWTMRSSNRSTNVMATNPSFKKVMF